MVLCQDVTAQIQAQQKLEDSESRFRLLSNEMPQFVWTGDAEGNLGYFNEAVYKYSGLSKEEIARDGWLQIVHPEDRDENIRLWTHAISTGEDFIFEHRFKRADGEYRWQLSRAIPQRDAQGIIQQWIGTSTDIQDRKNVEEQLGNLVAERTKELQRSNDDLQQFAHVASHDLKEPVRKVKTFTSRLEQHLNGVLDETSSRYIEKIHSATNRMFSMIDGVLTYSTINASTQAPEKVDLNEVMKNIEADFEVIIQKTEATLTYGELPTIEGAPVLLYQLFYNLVNNAIKFAKADIAPEIIITSEMISDGHRKTVKLNLSDNGIGFEEEQSKSIFETFTRLNSKDKYEGTGLGLALCKKIVERHCGSISASGVPGVGATFTILLPIQQNERVI
jgi:PAS domain S-box-containing protein